MYFCAWYLVVVHNGVFQHCVHLIPTEAATEAPALTDPALLSIKSLLEPSNDDRSKFSRKKGLLGCQRPAVEMSG